MQVFASDYDRVKKKERKMKKLINGIAEVGNQSGSSAVADGKVHKRKSRKCKTFAKHEASKRENEINSSCDTEHFSSKKKKSGAAFVINGHKIKSKKISDVISAVEQKEDKNGVVTVNCDSSFLEQSDASKKGSEGDKKRKRKNKEHKTAKMNSENNMQCMDGRHSKKLKTHQKDESDKTVIGTGNMQPGAFENYRISQSLVDKLKCT